MVSVSGFRSVIKDLFLPVAEDAHTAGKYRLASWLRLLFVLPLLYGFTLYSMILTRASVDTALFRAAMNLWISLAALYVLLNVSALLIGYTRVSGILSIICIAVELTSNEIVIFLTGVVVSHALIFIILAVAIYRVYFDYRQGLFAAAYGTLLHVAVVLLFLGGALPSPPVRYAETVADGLPEMLIWASTVTLAIGVIIAFTVINLGMNRMHRMQRQLAENWKRDLESLERFNEQVMECPDESGIFAETIQAVRYATPYNMAALLVLQAGLLRVGAASGWPHAISRDLLDLICDCLPGNNEMTELTDPGADTPIFCLSLECSAGNPVYLAVSAQYAREPDARQKSMLMNIAQSAGDAINMLRLLQLEQEKGYTDGLTNLYNKRYLLERLPGRLALASESGETLCVAVFDIDGFKSYNDTFGHLAGDALLKRVADAIRTSLREKDAAVRFGGEEFLVVFSNTGRLGGRAAAERMRKAVERIDDDNRPVTVSGGLSVYPEDGADAEQLIECADKRLYKAKKAGKNRVFAS